MKTWKVLLLITVVMFVSDLALGQGCSQCKLLAEQGAGEGGVGMVDEDSFGSNINYGIIFLMTVPYIILFTFFIIFFRKRISTFFRSLSK